MVQGWCHPPVFWHPGGARKLAQGAPSSLDGIRLAGWGGVLIELPTSPPAKPATVRVGGGCSRSGSAPPFHEAIHWIPTLRPPPPLPPGATVLEDGSARLANGMILFPVRAGLQSSLTTHGWVLLIQYRMEGEKNWVVFKICSGEINAKTSINFTVILNIPA